MLKTLIAVTSLLFHGLSLVMQCAGCLTPNQNGKPRVGALRVLLVGASDYPTLVRKGEDPRKFSLSGRSDVLSLAEMFRVRFGVPDENIKVLHLSTDLSREAILSYVDNWLIGQAKPGDSLVFWWSGHGVLVPTGKGNETIGAIVPTNVVCLPDGRVESRSLILARELKYRFGKAKDRGIEDVAWFLDSCYSGLADRGKGRSRSLDAMSTPALSERLAVSGDQDPIGWTIVSAGNERQTVQEVVMPDGTSHGPLTASFLKLAPKISAQTTYRDLGYELRTIALSNREFREPQVIGALDRPIFGGSARDFDWSFPIAKAKDKLSDFGIRLRTSLVDLPLDPELPFIPAGQLMGIQTGMRFRVHGPTLKDQVFVVSSSYAEVAQLRPLTGEMPMSLAGCRAMLTDSLGQDRMLIGLDPGLKLDNHEVEEMTAHLMSHPFIRLVNDPQRAQFTIRESSDNNSLEMRSSSGDLIGWSSTQSERSGASRVERIERFIRNQIKSHLVRRMTIGGLSMFEVQAEVVPVVTNKSPAEVSPGATGVELFPTSLPAHMPKAQNATSGQTHVLRLRVRLNKSAFDQAEVPWDASHLEDDASVFISVLSVDSSGSVSQLFPKGVNSSGDRRVLPNRIALQRDAFSPWMYLGTGGRLFTEREAGENLTRLKVWWPSDNKPGSTVLQFIATDKFQDFSALLTNSKSGKPETAVGQLVEALSNEQHLPQDRGNAVPIQAWGLYTVALRIGNLTN